MEEWLEGSLLAGSRASGEAFMEAGAASTAAAVAGNSVNPPQNQLLAQLTITIRRKKSCTRTI
jgi:hypothetical protein